MTADLVEELKKTGMSVTPISEAETARMRERLQPVIERYTQDIGPSIVEQAQREIAEVRGR